MAKSKKPSLPSKWKGAAISALGSVPMKGVIKKGAKALNKASKAAKKKVNNTKKKVVASLKTQKKTVKKKIGKIVKKRGKVFTKARKLKNNLTNKEQINNLKKKLNKAVLAAKSIPKKTANYVKDNAKNIASFAADSTPIVGTVKAFQQAATGVDLITGERLSTGDRIAEGVGGVVAIFPIPGAKHVGKYGTKGIIKFGEFAADVSTNFVNKIKGKVDEIPSKPSKPSKGTGNGGKDVNKSNETNIIIQDKAKQQEIIHDVESGKIKLETNKQKGNYGEMKMDVHFESKGFDRISKDRVTSLDNKIDKGIDGVYYNQGPPPKYIVAEAKYGSSQLKITKDGRQMSDTWIEGKNRLERAVGKDTADDILLEGYDRALVNIREDGSVITKMLDAKGNTKK